MWTPIAKPLGPPARRSPPNRPINFTATATFYGDRHYTARDPEGHLWTFGQHIRDVSEEECLEAMKQMGGGE